MSDTLGKLETIAYRKRFDDGLLDLFIGGALLFIGAVWVWFEDFAGLAGIIPAILAMPFSLWRGKFVERRAGYVRFSEARRSWERRNLVWFVLMGVGMLALAVGAFFFFKNTGGARDFLEWLGPGLIAILIAVMVGAIAAVSRVPRLAAYTAILVAGGFGAAFLDTNPGVPLLAAGVVVTVWGAVLTTRFVHQHPATEEA